MNFSALPHTFVLQTRFMQNPKFCITYIVWNLAMRNWRGWVRTQIAKPWKCILLEQVLSIFSCDGNAEFSASLLQSSGHMIH